MATAVDPLAEEAIAILDAEATRRIDEIQQSIDFICSSLRAQGNMTISQLLQSVRALTMDEYCNKYHADTSYFLKEQARQRKELTMVTPGKKRSHNNKETLDTLDKDGHQAKKKQIVSKHKDTPVANTTHQLTNKKDEQDEMDFGPLFMQFLRPGQPKVTFQFDPQEELDPHNALRLQVPYEFVDQFEAGHRRRIGDQIQHIQDQLESFKQRLLQPHHSPTL
ncbi:hypothetical protein BC941DRAFT_501341 [Chlamydoabsidia padenii]|nr:hypothetical protein BC941DRAFT_501341 [Chlamydoabsidia padenii]